MACRYLYYVEHFSIIPDYDYDMRERDYSMLNGRLPVGSSNREDYSPAVRALALYFFFSGRTVDNPKHSDPLL